MNRADSDAAWNEKREQKAPDVGDEYDVHDEHASDEGQKAKGGVLRSDGKIELLESEAYDKLGYSFPTWKKWMILSVTFCIQISINLNASLYANAVPAISEKYGISKQAARIPQMTFLVAYGFGCELWAPWSEEYGDGLPSSYHYCWSTFGRFPAPCHLITQHMSW